MSDASPSPAGVAIVPCYNEGRNPLSLCEALLSVPDLRVELLDDGSEGESRHVLDELARTQPRVTVHSHASRLGKVASLLAAMRRLGNAAGPVLLVDCDVVLTRKAVLAVLE